MEGGVGAYARPAGVTDLVTAADDDGNIHAVYARLGALWYVKFDRQLSPSEPLRIAGGLRNFDLAVAANGTVFVVAYDAAAGAFALVEIAPDGRTVARKPVVLDGLDGVTIADPFPYQATRDEQHFIYFLGQHEGQVRGLLYSRSIGEDVFVHRDTIDRLAGERQINRACFDALSDGSIRLIATHSGGQAIEATVAPNSFKFSGIQNPADAPLNFGAALDPVSGTSVICDRQSNLREYGLRGDLQITPLQLPADHHGQGANRRTLAFAPDGNAVLLFGGNLNEYRHSVYRKLGGKWTKWIDADSLGMAAVRVHYHKPTGQFVFLGRKDAKLGVYSSKLDAPPQLVCDLPQTEGRSAGITITTDPRHFERTRYQWGFFAGVKGSDLVRPDLMQTIGRQMNLHGGINLNKVHRYQLDFPDPPQGYGAMFMSRDVLDRMMEKLRADTADPHHGGGYHYYLYHAEPSARPLIDFWKNPTAEAISTVTERLRSEAQTLLNGYVNGDGIYNNVGVYWYGGLQASRLIVWIDEVLASEIATEEEKAAARAVAAFFGYLLWDDDFVPLFAGHGCNLGTPNMPVMQENFRQMYTLFLANHPVMAERTDRVAETAIEMIYGTVNEHGSHMGSSHYLSAAMAPLVNTLVQLKQAQVRNVFATEERLRRFAEFYMQFATPPDPRFDNRRVQIPTGDSEPNNPQYLAGVLGTAYADTDPQLSARLMGSWAQSGKPHTGFQITTLLMTDEELPQAEPQLGSAVFPGYMAVLRSGWGTPHESAAWLVAGQWYRDHRNDEHSIVSIYAHAAPLALNWGSMYSPHAFSGMIRSKLLPASFDWKAVPAPHRTPANWQRSELGAFTAERDGGTASSVTHGFGAEWQRTINLAHTAPEQPVFMLQDTFKGDPMVFSLAMACEDQVQTPEGARKPGEGFTIPAGVSRIGFTGQRLDAHHSGGIDWNIYVIADRPHEGFLTEWGHENRRPQKQVILRLKGDQRFRVVIVPWPKGKQPENIRVAERNGGVTVSVAGRTVSFDAQGRRMRAGAR